MIVKKNLLLDLILHYTRWDLLYYLCLAITVTALHERVGVVVIDIPDFTIAALSVALAIFLGFKNNHAYDRWWEARKTWGLLVNYSRAWARQCLTLILADGAANEPQVQALQRRLIYRHLGFVNALRVYLRQRLPYRKRGAEPFEARNEYEDVKKFVSDLEYDELMNAQNPPNYLIQKQGEDLSAAFKQGWLSDYRFMRMDKTLVDFNDIQGISERIKMTPLPRQYTFYSRVFVLIHCTLLPMVFVSELGWKTVPVAFAVSFVFHVLDLIGERTEDPFENRLEDVPLSALSLTIESNLREQLAEPQSHFPPPFREKHGIVM